MAACIGASAAGARAFTATSSQGLALMHELLHWAAGGRLPIVMANINRAMAPGWNDLDRPERQPLPARHRLDPVLLRVEPGGRWTPCIQAFKVAEKVMIPAMVVLDAFALSHTYEVVDIPDQALVDKFLPPFKPASS